VPRENFDRNLPLSTLAFESRGMLRDRVYGVTQTLFHEPYYQRHIVSGLLPEAEPGGGFSVRANYLVIRTKAATPSEVYNAGRYFDRIVERDGALLFAEKICVFDSELIANSLIYPI
jgi:salicylate 5-hydroxylase small subunit